MISIGFDYSTRIAPAALEAAECHVVFRYVTTPNWPKSITPEEYEELRAAGITVILNDETTTSFMLGGYDAGIVQAHASRARADVLGVPAAVPIFYSLDIGATAEQITTAMQFLQGALDAEGGVKARVGAYGEFAFVKAAADAGFPTWGTVGWSDGQRDPRAVAWQTGVQQQVGGVTVDVNDLRPSAFPDIQGSTMGTYTVTDGWESDYPDVAPAMQQHIPVGTVVDETQAAAYAMMRSFVAAERTEMGLTNDQKILAAITALSSQLGAVQAVSRATLTAAVTAAVDQAVTDATRNAPVTSSGEAAIHQAIASAIAMHVPAS
jgi:hypothetical protein